jgi:hypothetical protein
MVPLFGPVPGGPELLIITLVTLLLFFGPVVAVVYLLVRESDADGVDDDELAEMQGRIDELEAEIAADAATDDEDGAEHVDDAGDTDGAEDESLGDATDQSP